MQNPVIKEALERALNARKDNKLPGVYGVVSRLLKQPTKRKRKARRGA